MIAMLREAALVVLYAEAQSRAVRIRERRGVSWGAAGAAGVGVAERVSNVSFVIIRDEQVGWKSGVVKKGVKVLRAACCKGACCGGKGE
jgi:hypothetical protein